jgi:hypothetical protein
MQLIVRFSVLAAALALDALLKPLISFAHYLFIVFRRTLDQLARS